MSTAPLTHAELFSEIRRVVPGASISVKAELIAHGDRVRQEWWLYVEAPGRPAWASSFVRSAEQAWHAFAAEFLPAPAPVAAQFDAASVRAPEEGD